MDETILRQCKAYSKAVLANLVQVQFQDPREACAHRAVGYYAAMGDVLSEFDCPSEILDMIHELEDALYSYALYRSQETLETAIKTIAKFLAET